MNGKEPSPPSRWLCLVIVGGIVTSALGLTTSAVTCLAALQQDLGAHAAHTQSVTDKARLRYVRHDGADLLEEGQATGGLSGHVRVRFNVGATVFATFTISARNGSISGDGSGKIHGAGLYASFGGTMTITRGTGRYSHAHGHGGFYGTFNRHTYDSTVQTVGKLTY